MSISHEIPEEAWSDAWCKPCVAMGQLELVEKELNAWKAGGPHPAFDPFCELISRCEEYETILEIGCGCGHYTEVLFYSGLDCPFTGVDISIDAIEIADKRFGNLGRFVVGDAANLDFDDQAFSCVVLGSVTGCVADWETVLYEASRVSSQYLMLHRVKCHDAMSHDGLTIVEDVKTAYGVEMAERSFDETALIDEVKAITGGELIGEQITWSRSLKHWQMSCVLEKR